MNKDVKSRVKIILENNDHARDDDGYLALCYYDEFVEEFYFSCRRFIASNITDSITRARRQIQQDNPELQGSKHTIRQKHAQKVRAQKSQEKVEREFVNVPKKGILAFFGL